MLRTRVARSLAELEALRSCWQALYRQADCSLFQSFEWNQLAVRFLGDREAPLVVLVENDCGAALFPAAVTASKLTFLGDELLDYCDLLATGDETLIHHGWEVLGATGLSLSVSSLAGERAAERWKAFGFDPKIWAHAPRILSAEVSAHEFAQHHRSARLLKKLQCAGVRLQQHSGSESQLVRWIYEQKARQATGQEPNLFLDPTRVDFMVRAAAVSPAPCEIFSFESENCVVAALVTFREQRIRRFYTTWYDRRWADWSPGTALLYEVTRRSLLAGLDCDYLTGEQPHKLRLATSSMPLYEVEASLEELWQAAGSAERLRLAA